MQLFVREYGSGNPVVILHGLYGSSDNWMSIARVLLSSYRVILVDLRNHGHSPKTTTHSYSDMRDDLVELVTRLNLTSFHLVGHSMGGKVAMAYAADYPEFIKSLTVVDIAPKNYLELGNSSPQVQFHNELLQILKAIDISPGKTRVEIESHLSKYIPDALLRGFLLKNLERNSNNGFHWRINIPVLIDSLDHIISCIDYAYFEDRLPIFAYPVLFIRGEISGYITDDDILKIKRIWPEAFIETIPKSGHWLHYEKQSEFIELLTKLFRQ